MTSGNTARVDSNSDSSISKVTCIGWNIDPHLDHRGFTVSLFPTNIHQKYFFLTWNFNIGKIHKKFPLKFHNSTLKNYFKSSFFFLSRKTVKFSTIPYHLYNTLPTIQCLVVITYLLNPEITFLLITIRLYLKYLIRFEKKL